MSFLITRIRFLRAWLAWARSSSQQPTVLEALFAAPTPSECPLPLPDCETCGPDPLAVVSSLDPIGVGRQQKRGEAILDVAAWLEASGWADVAAGERQQYACYLLRARADYERGGAVRP